MEINCVKRHTDLGFITYKIIDGVIQEPIECHGRLVWRWNPEHRNFYDWEIVGEDEAPRFLSLQEVEETIGKPLATGICDLNCTKHFSYGWLFEEENKNRKRW